MIQKKNKRRQAGGYYLPIADLQIALEEAYPEAIDRAALEVEEGRYQPEDLAQKVNRSEILQQAMTLILTQDLYFLLKRLIIVANNLAGSTGFAKCRLKPAAIAAC